MIMQGLEVTTDTEDMFFTMLEEENCCNVLAQYIHHDILSFVVAFWSYRHDLLKFYKCSQLWMDESRPLILAWDRHTIRGCGRYRSDINNLVKDVNMWQVS